MNAPRIPLSFRGHIGRSLAALSGLVVFALAGLTTTGQAASTVILVTGAGGEDRYTDAFAKWTGKWETAAQAAGASLKKIAATDQEALAHLRETLQAEPVESTDDLWVVLLGHGVSDGRDPKFNLPGDDLAVSELNTLLKPFHRPVIVVCSFSAGGAFLKPLSTPGRVVVTATRNGSENNYARFGGFFSEAIADPSADLDKDGQTSLLEAWLAASQRTAAFYKNEERLATEHSLLDDNGDGLGTPADWFQGTRVVKKSSEQRTPDGLLARSIHLVPSPAERALPATARHERDGLEQEIEKLREAKAAMKPDDYYAQLESLLLKLAKLYQANSAVTGD